MKRFANAWYGHNGSLAWHVSSAIVSPPLPLTRRQIRMILNIIFKKDSSMVQFRVDASLVEILRLRFSRDFEPKFCHDIDAYVWSRFWSIILVGTLMLSFGQDFEAEAWSIFWYWILLKILRLKSDRTFWSYGKVFKAEVWSRTWG